MSDEKAGEAKAGEENMGEAERVLIRTDKAKLKRGQKTTLLMLSGGIDSVYLLAKLLQETDDEVLAHHIHLVNEDRRHIPEGRACRKIVDYCKAQYRDFTFSESAIDHRGFRFIGYDMVSVGFEAGIVAHSFLEARGRPVHRWMIGHNADEGGWSERWTHVEACLAANCFPAPPPDYFSFPLVSKLAQMDYLGDELLDLTWICRTPRYEGGQFHECGACQTCKVVWDLRAQRAARGPLAGT